MGNSIQNMSMCANCGKGEEDAKSLKTCVACKMVKYCNATCQKAHRPQHKKACNERTTELHKEELFKQPPQKEDCPICLAPLPFSQNITHQVCCGTKVCHGCNYSMYCGGESKKPGDYPCPFCRHPLGGGGQGKVYFEMIQKRMDVNDASAIYQLGDDYFQGYRGLTVDKKKAFELHSRAAKLGHEGAHVRLHDAYEKGEVVERNKKKATYHLEMAAILGSVIARHNLAVYEERKGDYRMSMKHFMIAARSGWKEALEPIKRNGYMLGIVTKDEFAETLRACQVSRS